MTIFHASDRHCIRKHYTAIEEAQMSKITHVVKRSGAIVPFNPERITNAIYRAAVAVGGRDRERAKWLSGEVVKMLEERIPPGHKPHIEGECR